MFSPINKNLKKVLGRRALLVSAFMLAGKVALAQTVAPAPTRAVADSVNSEKVAAPKPIVKKESHWYDKISLRGYTQIRYNRLLETNPNLKTDYDKSVGQGGGFLIRRARLVFSGNVHDRVYIYIQPDLASTPSGSSSTYFAQIRDAYFDLALDSKKEYRLRLGQSKIPFGFENLQSSQNRLTLDRNDALNSALPNERDLGVIFYWAPDKIRKRLGELASRSMKGSGDYGVFGFGVYNGQTANRNDANDNLHVVARLSYPFALKSGQIVEPGIQAYHGLYNVGKDQLSSSSLKGGDFIDSRIAGSLVVYPQPFGFQMEYNVGKGPEFTVTPKNPGEPSSGSVTSIQEKSLKGGYAQAMYLVKAGSHTLIPFVKAQYYNGAKKIELDARGNQVYETEIGVEWQPIPAFELVGQYSIMDRTTRDGKNLNNRQFGNLLRLQAQFNF